MKRIIALATLLFALNGCIPLMVGGAVGYIWAKDKAQDQAYEAQKVQIEQKKLELEQASR